MTPLLFFYVFIKLLQMIYLIYTAMVKASLMNVDVVSDLFFILKRAQCLSRSRIIARCHPFSSVGHHIVDHTKSF